MYMLNMDGRDICKNENLNDLLGYAIWMFTQAVNHTEKISMAIYDCLTGELHIEMQYTP